MATLTITKTSGVIFIRQGAVTNNPKSYFGATGHYQASTDNTTIFITICTAGQTKPDEYTVAYGDLTVGTSVPPNMNTALVLLNSIFGS